MTIYRISPRGLEFHITELGNGKCEVKLSRTQEKFITVDAKIEQLSQSWYNWQMKAMHIQDAFPYLPVEHREFILTGITPAEWDAIFSEKDN